VDLTGKSGLWLSFWWKANSFESSDVAYVKVYDGSWHTVKTIVDGNDTNTYYQEDIDLSSYTMGSGFKVRFEGGMDATNDYLYIDDIEIAP